MTKRQVVIVDDDKHAREAVKLYAVSKNWICLESDGSSLPNKDPALPTIVLLDYNLGEQQAENWLTAFLLKHRECKPNVYLLTGSETEDPRQFAERHRLKHLLKPYDLRLLDTLFPETESKSSNSETDTGRLDDQAAVRSKRSRFRGGTGRLNDQAAVFAVIQQLPVAIRLLDIQTQNLLFQNRRAEDFGFEENARRTVQNLLIRLREDNSEFVESLEWQADRKSWNRWLAYRTQQGYWIREERSSQRPATDLFKSRVFSSSTSEQQLGLLADMLLRGWNITRLRFYRIAHLYCNPGEDTEDRNRFVLQPIWQSGGGFATDEENWKNTEFLLPEFHARHLFSDPDNPIGVAPASDDDPTTKRGCEAIEWGNAGNCGNFAIWDKSQDKDRPIGLLVFDRRTNHLHNPPPVVPTQQPTGKIETNELASLRDFFAEINPMLRQIIKDIRASRQSQWDTILHAITEEMQRQGNATELFTFALEKIRDDWSTQSGALTDAYIITVHNKRRYLEPLAGVGPLFELHGSDIFEFSKFFDPQRDQPFVVQAFDPTTHSDFLCETLSKQKLDPARIEKPGSWLAIPLRRDNRTLVFLAFGAPKPHYFTEHRVQRLSHTALTLLPILNWAGRKGNAIGCGGRWRTSFKSRLIICSVSRSFCRKKLTGSGWPRF